MPSRVNENLSVPPIIKDLRNKKVASDSNDIDNVYYTEEGWVYRHYKNAAKTKYWDEIIVAGQVVLDDPLRDETPVIKTVSATPDRVNLGTTPNAEIDFEGDVQTGTLKGDGKVDFEYSPTVGAVDPDADGDGTVDAPVTFTSPTTLDGTPQDGETLTVTAATFTGGTGPITVDNTISISDDGSTGWAPTGSYTSITLDGSHVGKYLRADTQVNDATRAFYQDISAVVGPVSA